MLPPSIVSPDSKSLLNVVFVVVATLQDLNLGSIVFTYCSASRQTFD